MFVQKWNSLKKICKYDLESLESFIAKEGSAWKPYVWVLEHKKMEILKLLKKVGECSEDALSVLNTDVVFLSILDNLGLIRKKGEEDDFEFTGGTVWEILKKKS